MALIYFALALNFKLYHAAGTFNIEDVGVLDEKKSASVLMCEMKK